MSTIDLNLVTDCPIKEIPVLGSVIQPQLPEVGAQCERMWKPMLNPWVGIFRSSSNRTIFSIDG